MKLLFIEIRLLIIALLISIASFGQEQKPQYKKFVAIQPSDVNNFIQALENWKRLVIYDPKSTAESKVKTSQDIDAYLTELLGRIKLDSVRIDTIKIIQPKGKKK